ncbi:zinc ribbon domain-containing protein [Prosthecobacter sp.]|uniref:zinc ribbon domain-containing protein n=1 Tax=Prosthecobacter sp. TaxID=1965333 RepID=UPI0037838ACB
MSEVTAISKFACPACGAEAVWNPSKKALVCPYCGTVSPAELKADGTLVEENDLAAMLRSIPDNQRGWNAARKTVKCQSCNAISVFDEKRVAQNCDFCGSPAIIAVDDVGAPIRPGSQLPFKVPESQVREDIRRWYGSHFWAPNALGQKAMTDTLHGMYLPFWTFDAHAECPWEAEAGYHYYTTDDKGNRQQHTRWEYASGHYSGDFDDLLVPASKGVHGHLLEKLQPFPTTTDLLPYDPGYLSGWVVEQYQIDLVQAAEDSRRRMDDILRRACQQQIPGDTSRNLQIFPEYSAVTFKHVLLPVWLLTYTYGTKTYQVTVNGATGKIGGEYPLSWVKITIAIVILLIILGIFFASQN